MTYRTDDTPTDKMEAHYRLQLSALIDGELSVDEARFLLRRLQHDTELSACWDRWQVAGEALRGQAMVLAPAGFSERVALAIAQDASANPAGHAAVAGKRKPRHLFRWGGGALAASFALVALFVSREQVAEPGVAPSSASPAIAMQAPAVNAEPAPEAIPEPVQTGIEAPPVMVASLPQRQDNAPRRSATRTRQAARVNTANPPEPMLASASAPMPTVAVAAVPEAVVGNPFSPRPLDAEIPARPWPRAVLPEYSGNGAFNAAQTTGQPMARTFYPFEPRLPAEADVDTGQDRPSPRD